MRRILVPLLVLVSTPVFAINSEQYLNILDLSGGLNSYYSSLTIADNEVKDAKNVLFDLNHAVTKRNGFTLYGSTGTGPITGSLYYKDANSVDWLIVRSSNTIKASLGNGTFTILVATVSLTAEVGATSAFGNIYFTDQNQGVYYWNATSTTYVSNSPHGSQITEFHGSLWVAGLAIPSQNQLWRSEYLNGSNWITATIPTSPTLFQVGLNDASDGITGLFSGYNDVLYVFKSRSIWGLTGFDQTDFQVHILNNEAGCVDSGSIQAFRQHLVFLSQRGIELFDGYNTQEVSRKIKDKVDPATFHNFNSRSWTQDTQADWAASTFSGNTVFVDTETHSGQIYMTFPDTFDSFRDGTSGTKNVWTKYTSGSATGSQSVSGGNLVLAHNGNTLGRVAVRTTNLMPSFKAGTTYHFEINGMTADSGDLSDLYFTLTSTVTAALGNPDNAGFTIDFESTGTNVMNIAQLRPSDSGSYTVFPSASWTIPASLNLYITTTTFEFYANGVLITSGVHTTTVDPKYIYMGYLKGSAGAGSVSIDNFGISPASFSFTSQIKLIGSAVTSFQSFNVTEDLTNGGNINWNICSSANSNMSGQKCEQQPINAQVVVGTNAYVTVNSTFSVSGATQTPNFDLFTLNWIEGTLRPKVASAVWDNRYWLSLTTTTADSFNDAVVVMSIVNQPIFSIFDIHAGSFVLYRGNLYHGDSDSTGNVYLDNQGYNDNGRAIDSFFTTKDYYPQGIFDDKFFVSIYVVADPLGNFSLVPSFSVERGDFQTLSTITQNEQDGIISLKIPFPIDDSHEVVGKTISMKFANSNINEPFTVYGGQVIYKFRVPQ